MGCFNKKGFLSGLTIEYGDDVVCFPCRVNTKDNKFSYCNYYTNTQLVPISLPLYGQYNDYGSIENIDENSVSYNIWKNVIGDNIEEYLKILSMSSPYTHTLKEIIEQRCEDFDTKVTDDMQILALYDCSYVLIFEHREIYDKLAHCEDINDDVYSFIKDLIDFNIKIWNLIKIATPISSHSLNFLDVSVLSVLGKNNMRKYLDEAGKLRDKHHALSLNKLLFKWSDGLDIMSFIICANKDYCFWTEEGLLNEFLRFISFNQAITNLGFGYNIPSLEPGQVNNDNELCKFYKSVIKFSNNKNKQ